MINPAQYQALSLIHFENQKAIFFPDLYQSL